MKKYKIKITKQLIEQLKPYWEKLQKLESSFNKKVFKLEKEMEKDIGIEGIGFFAVDGEYVGIGNTIKTMPLIHDRDLF